ncbi:OmpW/AlkL family protein [Lysobacter humi (ex Lee et al. 2017)]
MKHLSTLALLGTLAVAPCALAQETGTTGKRFAIVGGVAQSEPTGDATTATGARAEIDGDVAPTLGASWYVNENVAIEAWGAADKFGHRVKVGDTKAGSVDAQPYAVSGQYHFGASERTVRPFVGLGYYEMNFDDEQAQAGGPLAGRRIGIETAKGPMATVGADVNLGERWFARGDVRYLHGSSDLKLNGAPAGEVEANPVVVGLGIGARF